MAGLLSDVLPWVYSKGNQARRQLNGLLSDPMGTFESAAQTMQGSHQKLQGLLDQAQAGNTQAQGDAAEMALGGLLGFAPVGMMAGVGAKTANHVALGAAKEMEGRGVPPETIWKQTGWGKGPDGMWRFEINDSASSMTPAYAASDNMRQSLIEAYKKSGELQRLPQVLDHQGAINAYPDLARIHVIPGKGFGAGLFPEENRLALGEFGSGYAREAMLHEMQHAIQDAEGFAKGGTPEQFNLRNLFPGMRMDPESYLHQESMKLSAQMNPVRDRLLEQFKAKQITGSQVREAMSAEAKRIGLKDIQDTLWASRNPEQAYNHLAGEAEARLVQARMNLTPQQRAEQFPWASDYFQQSTGVPIGSLLFR